jgi:hypothetical protein
METAPSRPCGRRERRDPARHRRARPLTDTRGVIPGLDSPSRGGPRGHRDAARAARYKSEDAQAGLVLTGDQIITSRTVRDALAHEFPGRRVH